MCSRGGLLLCDIGAAAMWMWNLKFHILRLLTFMIGVWANCVSNTCWSYKTLSLKNSVMMAPWCQNMQESTPDMKYVLRSILL